MDNEKDLYDQRRDESHKELEDGVESLDYQEPYVVDLSTRQIRRTNPLVKALTKMSIRDTAIGMVLCFIVAVAWLIGGRDVLFDGEPQDIMTAIENGELKKGKHYTANVYAVLDNYSNIEFRKFITSGTEARFIILLDNSTVISVMTDNEKTIRMLSENCRQTGDYVSTEGIEIQGILAEMNQEKVDSYKNALNKLGINDEDYTIYYLEINMSKTKIAVIIAISIFFCMSLYCGIIIILRLKHKI